jgi:hypothetical protein
MTFGKVKCGSDSARVRPAKTEVPPRQTCALGPVEEEGPFEMVGVRHDCSDLPSGRIPFSRKVVSSSLVIEWPFPAGFIALQAS